MRPMPDDDTEQPGKQFFSMREIAAGHRHVRRLFCNCSPPVLARVVSSEREGASCAHGWHRSRICPRWGAWPRDRQADAAVRAEVDFPASPANRTPAGPKMVPRRGTKLLIILVFTCPSIHLYPLVKCLPLPKYALPCPATPSRKRWTIRWMENAGNESAIGSGHQDRNCWQAL
jgi:hypothetical protein